MQSGCGSLRVIRTTLSSVQRILHTDVVPLHPPNPPPAPFPGTSWSPEAKLATQKAPASPQWRPNLRVRSWSKNGKSSENRVDGASPALTGRGRKGNYNIAEVCLKTYWFVLVSQRQIWWKIWLQIVFTAPGDNLTPSTLSTQMQNCSFGLVWPLVYRESYYPSTPFPPFQSRSSLRTIHNLILSELVMAYLCCSYQTITNQQFPLTRKWGWSIQGAPKKMHHSDVYHISVLEVGFFFFTCVLESEFWARLFHLSTQIVSIQNFNCPKNAENACADMIFGMIFYTCEVLFHICKILFHECGIYSTSLSNVSQFHKMFNQKSKVSGI